MRIRTWWAPPHCTLLTCVRLRVSRWALGIAYPSRWIYMQCASWVSQTSASPVPHRGTVKGFFPHIVWVRYSLNEFAANKLAGSTGPKWSQPKIRHVCLTLNQNGPEKWTGWTPWNKWCLSGFMHNNCLGCKWGHPSAVTYVQSNLPVPAKSFVQAPEPTQEVAVSARPGRREISQSPQDLGPSLLRRFQRREGNSGKSWDSVYILP